MTVLFINLISMGTFILLSLKGKPSKKMQMQCNKCYIFVLKASLKMIFSQSCTLHFL